MKNRWDTEIADERTGIENEGGALQVEGEGNSVGTDSDTFSNTIVVVDLVMFILQFGGGREESSKVNACVGATVVDTRVNQSLELMSEFRSRESESRALDGPP